VSDYTLTEAEAAALEAASEKALQGIFDALCRAQPTSSPANGAFVPNLDAALLRAFFKRLLRTSETAPHGWGRPKDPDGKRARGDKWLRIAADYYADRATTRCTHGVAVARIKRAAPNLRAETISREVRKRQKQALATLGSTHGVTPKQIEMLLTDLKKRTWTPRG
jgi:hypothetical protein